MLPDSLTSYQVTAVTAPSGTVLQKLDFGLYSDTTKPFYAPRHVMFRSNNPTAKTVDFSVKLHDVYILEHDTAAGGTTESLFPSDIIITFKSKRPAMDTQLISSANPITAKLLGSNLRYLVETISVGCMEASSEAAWNATPLGRAFLGQR